MNKKSLPFLVLSSASLLLAACSSTPGEPRPTPPAQSSTQPKTNESLRRGMTEEKIRALWGEPMETHDSKEGERALVYQFDVRTTQRMVAAAMVEVPAVDPITGEAIRTLEPQLTPQKVTVVQTIVLLLRDGQLAGWHRQLGEQRSFN